MQSKPFVSFVTPFYNTEAYLEECIKSVLTQGYSNWEYILLDNCSSDASAQIAERYVRLDPNRIRLERNSVFLSQVQNYNRALCLISEESDYCKFVQADDLLLCNCVNSMVDLAEGYQEVGIVGAYELDGDRVHLGGLSYPTSVASGTDVCRLYFLRHRYLFGTPTSLLLRSNLIRSRVPFYDEQLSPFEDAHACFDLLRHWGFGFVHQVLTYSRRDNVSINSRWESFKFEYLSRLAMVVVHGQHYLSAEEYSRCLKEAEETYFRFLARCACARRRPGHEFWEFHRKGLASLNYTLDWRLLSNWIPRSLIEKAVDRGWTAWDRMFA